MLKTFKRVHRYVTHDLKEIVAPSPLPDPPGEKPQKIKVGDIWTVMTTHSSAHTALYTLQILSVLSHESHIRIGDACRRFALVQEITWTP